MQKVERRLSRFCLFIHQLTGQLTMTATYSLVNSVIQKVLQLKETPTLIILIDNFTQHLDNTCTKSYSISGTYAVTIVLFGFIYTLTI